MREIRTAIVSDIDAVAALYLHLNPGRPEIDRQLGAEILQRIVDADQFQLFICLVNNRVVASCMLALVPNLMRGGRPHAFMENVVTHKDHRRRGHGRAIIKAALEMAWERRAHQVLLFSARPEPGVHEFYQECGFTNERKAGYVVFHPLNG
ncbi:MAG: GNAT family N-acetyltransferase [Alphaproteobacteria bacterium]